LYNENGSRYKGDNGYLLQVTQDIDLLKKDDKELSRRVGVLQKSKEVHTISHPADHGRIINSSEPISENNVTDRKPTGSEVNYAPENRISPIGEERNPRIGLAHDLLGHSYDFDQGTTRSGTSENGVPNEEVDAVKVENIAGKAQDTPEKTTYDGKTITPAELSAPLQDVK